MSYNAIMKTFIASLSTLLIVGSFCCSAGNEITPHPPVITDSDMCPAACENLRSLGCDEGNPIDMGVKCLNKGDCQPGTFCDAGTCHATCDQFCRETQAAGVFLDPTCVSEIVSCKQINGCPATVKQ